MGKTRRGEREITREKRLTQENKRLKREVAQLRKQLARVDLDRYQTVREMIDQQWAADQQQDSQRIVEDLKKTWTCRECQTGVLEIILYNKLDSTWYYRACSNCNHRTKAQKYDPVQVRGIIKKSTVPSGGTGTG